MSSTQLNPAALGPPDTVGRVPVPTSSPAPGTSPSSDPQTSVGVEPSQVSRPDQTCRARPASMAAAGAGAKSRSGDRLSSALVSFESAVENLRNPDALFGRYVGAELGKIKECRKMETRIEIMQVLKRAHLQD